MRLGPTILRIVVGALFAAHGLQKLAGKFGGQGPEATGQFLESLGIRPGREQAIAAGTAETAGGTLLAAGALTPLGAAALTATMATAIKTVHGPKGPWNAEGGYEYNLVLLATVFAFTSAGPGPWSVDAARGRERWGTGWAFAQLGAGLAGSAAALAYGRSRTPSQADATAPEEATGPAPVTS